MSYKLGSLFDGSGGFPLAGVLCGIEPVWAAEVEPYPIAVTKSRFPKMKHLGNISLVNGREIEPVDIITFGSPCQDLSVAGKRAGLKHESNGDEETTRSGLFMEAVRIIKEMREATNGKYPTFALWENVPGAFSSNKGEDFRIVCEELIKIVEPTASMPDVPKNGWAYSDSHIGNGWSIAYRVLDAQYWGVPQRRRRIYLVADFRGERAGKILFEREGLRGYFAQGRTPWKATASDAQEGAGSNDRQRVVTVDQGGGKSSCSILEDKAPTLCTTHGGEPAVAISYTLKIRSGCEGGGKGALVQEDKSETLATNNDQYLFQPIFKTHIIDNIGGQAEYAKATDINGTLRAGAQGAVAYELNSEKFNQMQNAQFDFSTNEKQPITLKAKGPSGVAYGIGLDASPVSHTLIARAASATGTTQDNLIVSDYTRYIVRRLTPTECARLQGFPDWWGSVEQKDGLTEEEYRFWLDVRNTHALINGKKVQDYTEKQMLAWYNKLWTDSAEYKMWGNGIALPTALYCLQGIADVCEEV